MARRGGSAHIPLAGVGVAALLAFVVLMYLLG